MTPRLVMIVGLAGSLALVAAGCSSNPGPGSRTSGNALAGKPTPIDPQAVQASTMNFAVRFVTAMADVCDRVKNSPDHPRAQEVALRIKLLAGQGAMGDAVDPNPIVGLMDLTVMVTLTRETLEDPWAAEALGPDNSARIVETLKTLEGDIWALAGSYLTSDQTDELHGLAERWRRENPGRQYVGGARLADFPESKESKNSNNPGLKLASGIFGLVKLDPFTGLDPAVRQVEESRVLAERMFFYLQNMPTLLSWQTDSLYAQMLSQPEVAQLFKDTSKFSTNTTGFTQATTDFAGATARFAQTIENFRTQLPEQQATLARQANELVAAQSDNAIKQATANIATLRDTSVKQLNDLVAEQRDAALEQASAEITAQREAALKQASAEISVQRDEALRQLSSTVTAQQDLMTKNLNGLVGNSIDLLYQRTWSLILIAAGAILATLVIYRFIVRLFFARNVKQVKTA